MTDLLQEFIDDMPGGRFIADAWRSDPLWQVELSMTDEPETFLAAERILRAVLSDDATRIECPECRSVATRTVSGKPLHEDRIVCNGCGANFTLDAGHDDFVILVMPRLAAEVLEWYGDAESACYWTAEVGPREGEATEDVDVRWETVGHVGVDSGMVVLADPFYVSGDRPALDVRAVLEGDDYSPVQSLTFDNGIDGGVIVGSGWGDGIYPVEARMSDGRVAEVRVRFMPHPVLGADPIALLTGRSSEDDETELPRCKHCGHDESYAGYGPVTEYKGVLLCKPCLVGVKAVEEEDGWVQDPTTLQWVKPGGQS